MDAIEIITRLTMILAVAGAVMGWEEGLKWAGLVLLAAIYSRITNYTNRSGE